MASEFSAAEAAPAEWESRLLRLCEALIDQRAARVIVPPQQPAPGFWFGGGNMIADDAGALYVVGRYRNAGDSRLGLAAGERGLELAIFRSDDAGRSFHKQLSWSKRDLNIDGCEVLSIEGSALGWTSDGVELFVSTEKAGIGYPAGFDDYLKPGAGVWTIDRLAAPTIDALAHAKAEPVLQSSDPQHLHVKDPFLSRPHEYGDDRQLLFCSHPFSWASSNTGTARFRGGSVMPGSVRFGIVPRGTTWDVAMTRGTCLFDVPRVGWFRDRRVSVLFYDGGECLRNHEEHQASVSRPRGYSCEELGGAAYLIGGDWNSLERLSRLAPLFVSPHGTGCSRYVDVLSTPGGLYATWQQSQPEGSQPLVMNFVPQADVERILS